MADADRDFERLAGVASGGMSRLLDDRYGPLFGDDEDEPYQFPRRLRRLSPDKLDDAAALARALGQSHRAERLDARIARYAQRHPDWEDTSPAPDYSDWRDLGMSSEAQAALMHLSKQRIRKVIRGSTDPADYAALVNRARIRQAKQVESAMKRGLIDEIDPSLRAAQQRADEMLGTSAVSASEEASLRSRIAATVRQNEASRMSRIAAALGMANTSASPAAAALAARNAEEADQTLVSTLRDTRLQVSQLNREDARRSIDLATRIATQRYNVLNGDSKSLIAMQGDIAETIDALYSRDQALELQKAGLEESAEGAENSWVGPALTAVGAIAAPFTGGFSLALPTLYGGYQATRGAQEGADALWTREPVDPYDPARGYGGEGGYFR